MTDPSLEVRLAAIEAMLCRLTAANDRGTALQNMTASQAARASSSAIFRRYEEPIVTTLCACVVELARVGCPEPHSLMRGYAAALIEALRTAEHGAA
ncbi:MAG: hypothetical protein LT106_18740 [Burkholderiaceae bacterium]|nr:hypothetical protein [Burkholderiaceae bacterium]